MSGRPENSPNSRGQIDLLKEGHLRDKCLGLGVSVLPTHSLGIHPWRRVEGRRVALLSSRLELCESSVNLSMAYYRDQFRSDYAGRKLRANWPLNVCDEREARLRSKRMCVSLPHRDNHVPGLLEPGQQGPRPIESTASCLRRLVASVLDVCWSNWRVRYLKHVQSQWTLA